MHSIDEIMDMLDWHQSEETQQRGRELASSVRSFNVFLQPINEGQGKNLWDNCAIILSEKTDEELAPYFGQLLYWLQDLNWPGAMLIQNRLKSCKGSDSFCSYLDECVKTALVTDCQKWLTNMSELLENETLARSLPDETLRILRPRYEELLELYREAAQRP